MLSHCTVTFLEIRCKTVCCDFVKHILRHTLLTHNTHVVDARNASLIKVTFLKNMVRDRLRKHILWQTFINHKKQVVDMTHVLSHWTFTFITKWVRDRLNWTSAQKIYSDTLFSIINSRWLIRKTFSRIERWLEKSGAPPLELNSLTRHALWHTTLTHEKQVVNIKTCSRTVTFLKKECGSAWN